MSFFDAYFSDVDLDAKEDVMVCCPFPHIVGGQEYFEQNPSAGINKSKKVFHCLRCGRSYSESGFIKEILGCSYETAVKLDIAFSKDDVYKFGWDTKYRLDTDTQNKLNDLGISSQVASELNIVDTGNGALSFPVFMYDKLVDVREYRPNEKPKIKSQFNAVSGLVIPYDILKESNKSKWCILCAGEKDMAVTRSIGLNAFTLTGGEMALPAMTNIFKDRMVAICYDNDEAGHKGALRVAAHIKKVAKQVKVVTGFHEVCKENGEDLTDFFTKYKKTRMDLIQYIQNTTEFTEEEAEKVNNTEHPLVTLLQASSPNYINKLVKSNIQIVASYESAMVAPTFVKATKTRWKDSDDKNSIQVGTTLTWELKDETYKDLLHLIDNKFTETEIKKNIKTLLRIPPKEEGIELSILSKTTVFKCAVTDLFESNSKDNKIVEYTAYVIGHKLESGKKYKATYKLVPHPYNGQQLIMIITSIESPTDSITNFKITNSVRESLSVIRLLPGNISEKVDLLANKVKGIINFDADTTLIKTIDLSFNTPLHFNFGRFKNVRGYLDTLVVSESRVGKSSTAEALRETYGLGTFTSLAGNSATVSGLIGGSNKVNGSFQTRAGLIPQNHRGLLIFEEFAKCNANLMKELTDIRSSNEVRITRVNGSLNLPAMVRMITLTNVRSINGINRSISSYPNGIEVLAELIGSAEDIARYDIMLVLANPGNRNIDPLWEPDTPLSKEVYQTRIRWIWSRTPEQIIIDKDTSQYIIQKCNELNDVYDSHIKIFGTEAWKKVSRLAIAIAGYVVSTDDSYENIIVTKECVDVAVSFFLTIYDNSTFKLRQYVANERRYNEIDQEGIDKLQEMYISNATLLNQLEISSVCSRNELMGACGLANDTFNSVINELITAYFIRFNGQNIIPTERFRKGMSKIRRRTRNEKVGETYVKDKLVDI